MKYMNAVVLLGAIASFAIPSSAPPAHASQNLSEQETENLAAIAQTYLEAQQQALVNKNAQEAVLENPLAKSFPTIVNRRTAMTDHHQAYTGFQVELTVDQVEVKGRKATLRATEHNILTLSVADDPLAPATTEYVQEHSFTFSRGKNKAWVLKSDKLLNIPGSQPAEKDLPAISPFIRPTEPRNFMPSEGSSLSAAQTASLNRTAIVNYALRYWSSYNNAYRAQNNDCTNFISQAVSAGGWPYVLGWYLSTSVWWYDWVNQSRTWIKSNSWALFTSNRPRASIAAYTNDLVPGDILQADWTGDGIIDHSTIVTGKDGYGTIYLTYHSNNTVNISLWDFLAKARNDYGYNHPALYGWHLYNYPN
jgi:hypothetical protein